MSKDIEAFALKIRQDVLAMAHFGGGAHIAPAYSITDILAVMFKRHLRFSLAAKSDSDRDRFVLSKGHGCAALYAILSEQGFFPREELKKYCKPGGILGGHPDMHKIPGVEASTGSLGHGFVFSVGIAQGAKVTRQNFKVFTLIGDGESQEGSIWEAALLAGNLKLNNLIAVLDYNKLQGMGLVNEINSLEPLAQKWSSFGWAVQEIDGHSLSEIDTAFTRAKAEASKPSMIIAHTIKGKGLSFMEGQTVWHYKLPKGEEMRKACLELQISGEISGVLPQ